MRERKTKEKQMGREKVLENKQKCRIYNIKINIELYQGVERGQQNQHRNCCCRILVFSFFLTMIISIFFLLHKNKNSSI